MRARASGSVLLHGWKVFVAVSGAMSASRSVVRPVRPTTCEGFEGLTETISPSVSTRSPPMIRG
jgi:hypothetical protein